MFKLAKQSDKAVLTIYGYVGGAYLDFRAVNAALDEISKSGLTRLDFHLHTYGGSVFDGNLIYNFLSSFKGEVDIYIDGIAASMGSIIMLAGTRIHIVENGFVMIHRPHLSSGGNADDIESGAKMLRSIETNMKAKLKKRCKADIEGYFDGADHWLDADECIALGLVDDKFDASGILLPIVSKDEVIELGAEGLYKKFAACISETKIQKPKSQMDKESLIKRYNLTGVTAQSSEEDVLAAVDAKIEEGNKIAKAAKTKAIEAAVDQAVEQKKITAEQKAKYVAMGEKLGVEELNSVFADMQAYTSITAQVGGKKEGGESREGWTWADYQAKATAELEAMPKKDPTKFKALYKAEFGNEPEL